MPENAERRAYERIHLLAYAVGKSCRLKLSGGEVRAALVDISNGGARLRLEDAGLPLGRGEALSFSLEGTAQAAALCGLASTVRWRANLDVGIEFVAPLGLPLRTLQDLVS